MGSWPSEAWPTCQFGPSKLPPYPAHGLRLIGLRMQRNGPSYWQHTPLSNDLWGVTRRVGKWAGFWRRSNRP